MQLQTKQLWIVSALALLMAATRFNHFGSSVGLPDASLAVFLLAGFFIASISWQSLLVFAFLLLEAGGIDYYATNMAGVSDWCITPAYWFLIPTYASMWLGGHWLANRTQHTLHSLALFAGMSCLATSAAFLISNGSFYMFSGRYSETGAGEYVVHITQYYLPYLSGSLMYIALIAAPYILLRNSHKSSIVETRN